MKYLLIMGLLVFFQSCGNPKFKRADFIGVWKANDNATVQLNEDGTVIIKAINLSKILDVNKKAVDFIGKWEFTTDMYKHQVVKINSNKYTFDFYISGRGAIGNKPPFDLYVFIGDPDEMNKYRFVKQ